MDEWLAELAAEEADAARLADDIDPDAGKIPDHAHGIWRAFALLHTERQVVSEIVPLPAGLPGAPPVFVFVSQTRELPIPWSALDRWALRHEITGQRFAEFERLITALDDEYLKIAAERQNRSASEESEPR